MWTDWMQEVMVLTSLVGMVLGLSGSWCIKVKISCRCQRQQTLWLHSIRKQFIAISGWRLRCFQWWGLRMNNKTHSGTRKQLDESESDTMACVRHSLFAYYQDKSAYDLGQCWCIEAPISIDYAQYQAKDNWFECCTICGWWHPVRVLPVR